MEKLNKSKKGISKKKKKKKEIAVKFYIFQLLYGLNFSFSK